MKKLMQKPLQLAVMFVVLFGGVTGVRAQSFSMQIVADNDFAIFGGTATSVDSLLYQNNSSWPDQLANLSNFSFALQPGETTFYILGMGGGGVENISGTVNGVDFSTLYTYNPDTDSFTYSISQSSDLASYLTGYLSDGLANPSVADGTFDASLSDVQTALPNLTWGDPTPTIPFIDDVAAQSPTGQGFHFDPNNAVLFRFNSSDVGVTPAPEPSTWAVTAAGLAMLGVKFYSRRGRPQPTV